MKLTREEIQNIHDHYIGIEGDAPANGITVYDIRRLCRAALDQPDKADAMPDEPSCIARIRAANKRDGILDEHLQYTDTIRAYALAQKERADRLQRERDAAMGAVRDADKWIVGGNAVVFRKKHAAIIAQAERGGE